MLAVDVRQALRAGKTTEQAAQGGWRFSADTVTHHGDYLLAFVDGGVCVGAFQVLAATLDPAAAKYTFELVRAEQYAWTLGRKLPLPPGRNPARVFSGQALRELLESAPTPATTATSID